MGDMANAKRMVIFPVTDNNLGLKDRFFFHMPAPYTVSRDAIYADPNVQRVGPVPSFIAPGLKTFAWSGSLFVSEWAMDSKGKQYFPPFVKINPSDFPFMGAIESIKFLEDMRDHGRVGRLQIIDEQIDIVEVDSLVQLRSFSWNEPPFEPDMRDYSLQFTEYRSIQLRRVKYAGSTVPHNPIRKKPDKYGRYTNKYYTTEKALGIATLTMTAYKKKGTTVRNRIIAANGGVNALKKKGMKWEPKNKTGPWIFPKGLKLYIPPVTGKIFPVR